PKNPADEAPLTDRPFPEAGPVRTALAAKGDQRRLHPGLEVGPPTVAAEAPPAAAADETRPVFDPTSVPRPPRPASSLDAPATAPAPPVEVATAPDDPEPASTNTFIAAARRAAQRQ